MTRRAFTWLRCAPVNRLTAPICSSGLCMYVFREGRAGVCQAQKPRGWLERTALPSVLRQDATRSVSIDQPAIASASTSSGVLYGASGSFATFRGIILV